MSYVYPVAQQNENEKAGRKETESEESEHCKEKNMADQWMHIKKPFQLKKTKMLMARPEGRELKEVKQSMDKDTCIRLERQRRALVRWVSMQDRQQHAVVNHHHTKYTTSSKMRKLSLGTLEEALP